MSRRSLVLLAACSMAGCDFPLDGEHEPPARVLASDSVGQLTTALVNFDATGARLTRFDVDGNALDAHGGEIRRFGDAYYLYGESYACGYEWKVGASPFCGFKVYSSPDLVHWTDRGFLFDATSWYWQSRCYGWTYGCYRPHVLYNEETGKYVLWFNSSEVTSSFHVLESDSPLGPFLDLPEPTVAANATAPPGINNGDVDLFQDDDGRAYMAYTDLRGGGDILVERLTPDYRSGTGEHVRLGLATKEAPSLFKRGERYYITMSDPNCGYCQTGTSFVTAPTPLGPWSRPKKLTGNSCGGQPGHVAKLPAAGGGSWYLYQSDLWNGGNLNQATADLYWGALSFDESGAIRPIECEPVTRAPVLNAGATLAAETVPPPRARLVCDVGTRSAAGEVQRELRFTPTAGTRLGSVVFPTFLYGWPDAPLLVELRETRSGAVLKRVEIAPERISWSARKLIVPLGVALEGGTGYGIRLGATTSRGCYGVAYRTDLSRASGDPQAYVSTDGGATWADEPGRTLHMELVPE